MMAAVRNPATLAAILAAGIACAAFAPIVAAQDLLQSDQASDQPARLIVVGNFNRDGIADLVEAVPPAIAHRSDPSALGFLSISLGQADGTVKPLPSHPALGHEPRTLVAGDFNGDGNLDLIVGDASGALTLFLGDGTGNLLPGGDIARLQSVVSIVVADFNRDGVLDLAVSDWRDSSVTIFSGLGHGAFQRSWAFPLRMRGTVAHLSTADFNLDGIPDLAVVYDDGDQSTFDVMLGNRNGTFTLAPELSVTKDPYAHCAT